MVNMLSDLTVYRKLYAPPNVELWRRGRAFQLELIDALRAGDPDTARLVMRDHMETAQRLMDLLGGLVERGKVAEDSHIVFVDDGSADRTWSLIDELASQQEAIEGIKLSRNRGHQNALLAGLLSAEGDVLVSIDADLQDDPRVIEEMVDRHREGYEIVYGVRRQRQKDAFFKRATISRSGLGPISG